MMSSCVLVYIFRGDFLSDGGWFPFLLSSSPWMCFFLFSFPVMCVVLSAFTVMYHLTQVTRIASKSVVVWYFPYFVGHSFMDWRCPCERRGDCWWRVSIQPENGGNCSRVLLFVQLIPVFSVLPTFPPSCLTVRVLT